MTIWTYGDQATGAQAPLLWEGPCFFCQAPMDDLASSRRGGVNDSWTGATVRGCPRCGWWQVREDRVIRQYRRLGYHVRSERRAAAGCLLGLDVSDQDVPIRAIRETLMIEPGKLGKVHHDRFERVVADVYRDLGYTSRAVGRSGDDGIDVILERDGERIGVQVKRYKGSIQVDQIRELAGALLLDGITRGIFVTTSRFTSGAPRTVAGYAKQGYEIDLIDGQRFLEQLEIAQREMYRDREELAATLATAELTRVHVDTGWDPIDDLGELGR